jgi:lysophospholipase L1-like esterase
LDASIAISGGLQRRKRFEPAQRPLPSRLARGPRAAYSDDASSCGSGKAAREQQARSKIMKLSPSRPLTSALLAAALAFHGVSHAQSWNTEHWVATWGASPSAAPSAAGARTIVRTSVGGNRVRIRLSNEMGSKPLTIGAAHIGLRAGNANIAPGTDRTLSFSGNASVTIPPGAPMLSDPVELNVPALSELVVSLYLAKPESVPSLTEVDVDSSGATVVVLDDSSARGKERWPDWLARRLQSERTGNLSRLGVVQRGASASALARFDSDVLASAGARYLIVSPDLRATNINANAQIAELRLLIARAHASGIALIAATATPFEGASGYSPAKDEVRDAVNGWIRGSGEPDGVIDFDAALRDPFHASRLLPAYDSGDHLHPTELGYQAMGNAVPLELFQTEGTATNR